MMKDDMTGKRLRRGNVFWQFRQIMFFSELVIWQLAKIKVGYWLATKFRLPQQ